MPGVATTYGGLKQQKANSNPQGKGKRQSSGKRQTAVFTDKADDKAGDGQGPEAKPQDGASRKPFDLEERTARFGEAVLAFVKTIPVTPITSPLITQLVKSGTSVGANYSEATEAGTRKEFRNFISICRREAKETKHWLRMIGAAVPASKSAGRLLWQEAKELHLILNAIHRKSKTASG